MDTTLQLPGLSGSPPSRQLSIVRGILFSNMQKIISSIHRQNHKGILCLGQFGGMCLKTPWQEYGEGGLCGSIETFPVRHASDTSFSYLYSISLVIVSIPTSNLYLKSTALDPLTVLAVLHRRHGPRAQARLEMDPKISNGWKRTWSPGMAGNGPGALPWLDFHLTSLSLSGVQWHGNGTWCHNNNMNFYTTSSGPLTIFYFWG